MREGLSETQALDGKLVTTHSFCRSSSIHIYIWIWHRTITVLFRVGIVIVRFSTLLMNVTNRGDITIYRGYFGWSNVESNPPVHCTILATHNIGFLIRHFTNCPKLPISTRHMREINRLSNVKTGRDHVLLALYFLMDCLWFFSRFSHLSHFLVYCIWDKCEFFSWTSFLWNFIQYPPLKYSSI